MSYTKNTWVDQDVERPKTYEVTNNQDGSITLTDSFGLVTELGTPVNAVNMNHIEDGIANCADIDLANLSSEGESHFLGKPQLTNCILEAPNGVATYSGSTITIKAGLKVLMPDGLNADGTLKNIEYTLENDVNVVRGQLTTQIAIFLKSDGVANDANFYFVVNDYSEITTNLSLYYVINENNIYYRNSQGSISKVICAYIGKASTSTNTTTSNITSLITQNPVNLATKDEIDGNWIVKKVELNTSTAIGTYAIDLSSILPQDGNTYELLLTLATAYISNTALAPTVYIYGGSYIDENKPIYAAQLEPYSRLDRNTFIYIIRSGEILYKKIANGNVNDCKLHLYAYRKVR